MVFSSLPFLFGFLPIVILLYFIAPKGLRNFILFISSLVFYAWGEPIYVVIMLFSTVVDFTHGFLVDYFIKKDRKNYAKLAVGSSMAINIFLLGFFKYSDFLITNINTLTGSSIELLNLALPIGISFYTFQTMSYTIDVYRGQAKVQRNIISFGAYVALFPQLIAGPIVQYKTIAEQLVSRQENVDDFASGVTRFITGIGKKVLIANNIGYLWNQVSLMDFSTLPALTAWMGMIAFALQIYFDFSAYSDMAIGLGRIFGFHFHENFDHPYMSRSITEFWRRWHISLGTWFREYVYIPLGGNRGSLFKQIRNIAIVWFLTGFWHGASWNFILWGVYFGVLLTFEKVFLLKKLQNAPKFVGHLYTLLIVIFSWVFFSIEGFGNVKEYFEAMLGLNGAGLIDSTSIYLLTTNLALFVVCFLGATSYPIDFVKKAMINLEQNSAKSIILKNGFLVAVFLLSVAYLVDSSFNPFLYFRF